MTEEANTEFEENKNISSPALTTESSELISGIEEKSIVSEATTTNGVQSKDSAVQEGEDSAEPSRSQLSTQNDSSEQNNPADLQIDSPNSAVEAPNNGASDFLDGILMEAQSKKEIEPENENSSDSSSDSSSDDSSDESDPELSSEGENDNNIVEDDADSGGEEEEGSSKPIASKNEVIDEQAPSLPENFTVLPDDPIEEIGAVIGLVEKSIIIKGNISGEFRFLKEGSVLCLEDRVPLGYLFEIFGPLAHPLYRIKYNSEEELKKFKDVQGMKVFYVVPKSNFVYTDSIKLLKGSDASNCNDEEVAEDEQEFSDDEKEMESKRSKNKKKRSRKTIDQGDGEQKHSTVPNKLQNRSKNDRKPPRNFQLQESHQQRQQSETNPFGYRSRHQREQQHQQPIHYQPPNQYYHTNAGMFQPPPQMAAQFPFSAQMPMPGLAPNMNPQQWQQFYQMQQMMMQQMYATQQGQSQPLQQNQQNPPPSNGSNFQGQ